MWGLCVVSKSQTIPDVGPFQSAVCSMAAWRFLSRDVISGSRRKCGKGTGSYSSAPLPTQCTGVATSDATFTSSQLAALRPGDDSGESKFRVSAYCQRSSRSSSSSLSSFSFKTILMFLGICLLLLLFPPISASSQVGKPPPFSLPNTNTQTQRHAVIHGQITYTFD